jgi:hypothetical protein
MVHQRSPDQVHPRFAWEIRWVVAVIGQGGLLGTGSWRFPVISTAPDPATDPAKVRLVSG